MKYSLYVFKKGKHENYTKDEGIVFTINGQTHGSLSKSFFNRKGVGLGYLADSILVILDCSEITPRSRENLFMNSRDRLSTCPLKTEIEKALEEELNNHQGLRILKDKRRQDEITGKLQNSQPLVEVLQDILKKSPTLSRLFLKGLSLQNPFQVIPSGKNTEYIGKEFPTFFTLSKKFPSDSPKQAHLKSKCRIEFKTDVSNDYLDRGKDPGIFKLFINEKESEDIAVNLWNGHAYLNILIDNYSVGETLNLRSEISDVSRYEPMIEEFTIVVTNQLKSSGAGSGQRKFPASDSDGSESKRSDGFAIPNIIEVSKDGRTGTLWHEQGFSETSALRIKGSQQDGYDFFVNIDNIHLLTELKASNVVEVKTIEAKYKFGLVLIGIAILQDYPIKQNDETAEEADTIFDIIEKSTKAISPVIIPMIDSLSSIDMNNIFSMSDES